MKILAHTAFIGDTGYANHARSFFTALNKYHEVKVRNYTVGKTWKGANTTPHDDEEYITDEMKQMLCLQTLNDGNGKFFDQPIYSCDNVKDVDVNIVLMDVNHSYFYEDYDGYKIAYNVWETTRYPEDFFNRLFYFNEVWVASKWQKECLIEQGYPEYRIKVVVEGVDGNVFKPKVYITRDIATEKIEVFRFLLFGRWEYRKSTTEIIKTFGETFKDRTDVELICSVENPYPFDGYKSTEERKTAHNIDYNNVKFVNFPKRDEYIEYLQNGHVFVSCARSEGWGLPTIESMACGTPIIYSNWGAQLEYASGLPVEIKGLKPANLGGINFPGEYCEPDYDDLAKKMVEAKENYLEYMHAAEIMSSFIRNDFSWDNAAKIADDILKKIDKSFVYITVGNEGYMPVIEKLVKSLNLFSKEKIIVYGVDCDVPFDYPNVIKRQINPPKHSEHDKWYWKQYACIESLKEEYENFVWIDGDVVVNYNIDNINQYFNQITNYPLSDIHVLPMYYGTNEFGGQYFNQRLCEKYGVTVQQPLMHVCLYVYNKQCKWWFEEIIEEYYKIPIEEYSKYLIWNDEGLDNLLRWKHNCMNHLPLSNFDTSSYDGDVKNNTNETMTQFYTFWNHEGPYNFNKIYGFQYFPKDKSNIIYFHGNKNAENSEKMIEFIKLQQNKSFYNSEYFYTNEFELKNLGSIKNIEGGTYEIAQKYGWDYGIYHEIYNLLDYYKDDERRIFDGNIVVDLGGNIGIFNRWAYSQGASKVISFEPDKRYFKLLAMNCDERSILFNSAVSDKMGEIEFYESPHLGGSSIHKFGDYLTKYNVRTYNLDYLFTTGLIDYIDFLKIDIEGAEIEVLKGISDENLKKVNNIAMEYHHKTLGYNENLRSEIIKRLNKCGFNSYLIYMGENNELQMIYFWR